MRQKCILNRKLYEVVHHKCSTESVATFSFRNYCLFLFKINLMVSSGVVHILIKTIKRAVLNFSLALSKKLLNSCKNNYKFTKMPTVYDFIRTSKCLSIKIKTIIMFQRHWILVDLLNILMNVHILCSYTWYNIILCTYWITII